MQIVCTWQRYSLLSLHKSITLTIHTLLIMTKTVSPFSGSLWDETNSHQWISLTKAQSFGILTFPFMLTWPRCGINSWTASKLRSREGHVMTGIPNAFKDGWRSVVFCSHGFILPYSSGSHNCHWENRTLPDCQWINPEDYRQMPYEPTGADNANTTKQSITKLGAYIVGHVVHGIVRATGPKWNQ